MEAVKFLIEHGARVNATTKNGDAVIYFAARSGNFLKSFFETQIIFEFSSFYNLGKAEIIEYLIEHGADIDAQNKDGRTALHWAIENGNCSNPYF